MESDLYSDLYSDYRTPKRAAGFYSRPASRLSSFSRPASRLSSAYPPSTVPRVRPRSSMAFSKNYGGLQRHTGGLFTPGRSVSTGNRSVSAGNASVSAGTPGASRPHRVTTAPTPLRTPIRTPRSSPASSDGSPPTPAAQGAVYSGKISVSVRPRPPGEDDDPRKCAWVVNPAANCVYSREAGEFFYDHVFAPDVDNARVYGQTVRPVVDKCLEGYNGTVFAYGMTGSGKTYSMQGGAGDVGIITLCVRQIFDHYRARAPGFQYKVSCSYLEIYNERLYDLLETGSAASANQPSAGARSRAPSRAGMRSRSRAGLRSRPASSMALSSSHSGAESSGAPVLRIRDDPAYGVRVVGLREVEAADSESLLRVIQRGDSLRRIGTTDYNARSSRSHAIVLIRLSSRAPQAAHSVVSTLCLCDLAGSEKASARVERRQEGSFINKSLLALGTVIAKLSQGKSAHIPYRDSKLTRLLQPSLSGKSVISVLCTIHLSLPAFGETVNTLRFASRAKNVSYHVRRQERSAGGYSTGYVEGLIRENERLRREVARGSFSGRRRRPSSKDDHGSTSSKDDHANGISSSNSSSSSTSTSLQLKERMSELIAENKILSEQLEHERRLNEEEEMDQIVGNNEGLQQLQRIQMQYEIPDDGLDEAVEKLARFSRQTLRKMEEMKSYILHLEQTVRDMEKEKAAKETATNATETKDAKKMAEKVGEQADEIEDLKRALQSKETVIKALKSTQGIQEMLDGAENRDARRYLKEIHNM